MATTSIHAMGGPAKPAAEIPAFRNSTPVIYVDGALGTFYVNVRPCPPFVASLESFPDVRAALVRASRLSSEHGWRVAVICDHADGAA